MSRPSRTTAAVRRSGGASNGSLHRTRLPYLPPGEHEALPQGREVLHQVHVREALVAAWHAPAAPPQGERLRASASREAEGAAYVRRARAPDEEHVRPRRRSDRRDG